MSTRGTDDAGRAPAFLARVPHRRRHVALVMDAEVKLIKRALEPFGLLSREELFRRTDAGLWSEGTFEAALRMAVERGVVSAVPGGFVELRRRRFAVRRRRTAGTAPADAGREDAGSP